MAAPCRLQYKPQYETVIRYKIINKQEYKHVNLFPINPFPRFANLDLIYNVKQKCGRLDSYRCMDGVFVPNISFGFPVLKAIQPISQKPF